MNVLSIVEFADRLAASRQFGAAPWFVTTALAQACEAAAVTLPPDTVVTADAAEALARASGWAWALDAWSSPCSPLVPVACEGGVDLNVLRGSQFNTLLTESIEVVQVDVPMELGDRALPAERWSPVTNWEPYLETITCAPDAHLSQVLAIVMAAVPEQTLRSTYPWTLTSEADWLALAQAARTGWPLIVDSVPDWNVFLRVAPVLQRMASPIILTVSVPDEIITQLIHGSALWVAEAMHAHHLIGLIRCALVLDQPLIVHVADARFVATDLTLDCAEPGQGLSVAAGADGVLVSRVADIGRALAIRAALRAHGREWAVVHASWLNPRSAIETTLPQVLVATSGQGVLAAAAGGTPVLDDGSASPEVFAAGIAACRAW